MVRAQASIMNPVTLVASVGANCKVVLWYMYAMKTLLLSLLFLERERERATGSAITDACYVFACMYLTEGHSLYR